MNFSQLSLFIFTIFTIFIILYFASFTKEYFTARNNIILLGDSILKNNSFVDENESIEKLLQKSTNANITCFAQNNSKIVDVFSQLQKISLNMNDKTTTIFLSVGGNNILEILDIYTTGDKLNHIFGAYKNLIKSIRTKMDNSNLILLDLYYPTNLKFAPYKDLISEWNKQIYSYSNENNIQVIKISGLLTTPEDFTFDIEPSNQGGSKIVQQILETFSSTFT
jgi:hypothetical protein